MKIKRILFNKKTSVQIQVNNIKQLLIINNVTLGKNFTFEIATLVLQIEKLIKYYDSKKLPSRFKTNLLSLEFTLSIQQSHVDNLSNKLNSIKAEFENAKMNEQKKLIIFELLFLHLDVLFTNYQIQELKPNNIAVENLGEKQEFTITKPAKIQKSIMTEPIKTIKNNSNTNPKFEKLTLKQKTKYQELVKELEKELSLNEKDQKKINKLRASISYYQKLIEK